MSPAQLREHLWREPFRPFRVRLKDGRCYEIRYPKLNLVGESVFIIGLPAPDDPSPRFYDRQVWVPLNVIDGIDLLPEPTPAGS